MASLALVLVNGCAAQPASPMASRSAASTPAPRADATSSAVPSSLDDASVKVMSHAFLDTYDRMDERAFAEKFGPTFAVFEDGDVTGRDLTLKRMHARIGRHPRVPTRMWNDEHVSSSASTAVFIAECTEHYPAADGKPAGDFVFWNTIVWAREIDGWRVAHWQMQKGGAEAARTEWNMTYSEAPRFNVKPNQLLVDTVKGRRPGAALDVAMGQGRNAIYLAAHGWTVTGVDISDEGIRIAREAATKQKLKLETIRADLTNWDYGRDKWDLVTLIYAGDDVAAIEKIKSSLKKGGLLVVEGFHRGEDPNAPSAFTRGQLATLFQVGYRILRDEVVRDIADWSLDETEVVRFVAEKL